MVERGVLGLPDDIQACLFDLDGVLTKTAAVHAAAWKQMFDDFLRKTADATGARFTPFDIHDDYDEYVDGKPREDGVRDFLASRGITLPEGTPDDPPAAADRLRPGQPQERSCCSSRSASDGVEVFDGSVRYLEAVQRAGLHRAVVSSSANTKQVLEVDRAGRLLRGPGRRGDDRASSTCTASRPPTPTSTRRASSASSPPARPCSRTRCPGWPAGHAGHFGYVVGVDRVGQAQALAEHGADRVVEDLAELLDDTDSQRRHPVIPHPAFETDPWMLRETHLDLDRLAQTESVFALGNGHIGVRGNLDEGEPHGLPGTYLNGFYEARPLPYAEAGYGYPEAGQTVVNVTNGKIIRLLVDDELFDLRYGALLHHERTLDFRTGLLHREVEWRSPGHRGVRVRSTRMVSLIQRAVMAIEYEVEVLDGAGPGGACSPSWWPTRRCPSTSKDPRVAAALERAAGARGAPGDGRPGLRWRTGPGAAGCGWPRRWTHVCDAPKPWETETESYEDSARVTVIAELKPGEKVRLVKLVAYGWSAERSVPGAARPGGRRAGRGRGTPAGTGCWPSSEQYLDEFWDRADVQVDGDPEIQQAVRFGLFQILQAGARAEGRAIPAKGLTGPGYDGHAFWDTESYVLPVLTYTLPHGGRGRAALAALDPAPGARAGQAARAEGRGVPVADHRGRGVLGLLAGRHRGVPRHRRHRRRGGPVPAGGRRRRTSPGGSGSSCWSRRPGCGRRSATSTRTASSGSTA